MSDTSTRAGWCSERPMNSMSALVACTGDPNPATLAQFNSQWQAAVSRWDDGVFKVYAGSTLTAPTIPTA
jgi:hypothetical protein